MTYVHGIGVLLAMVMAMAFPATADMGRIHVSTEGVQVSEDAQKAIILHNGEEEVLILGTDLRATGSTGMVRFIPFPAEPAVSLAPEGAFDRAAAMIRKYGLVFQTWVHSKGGVTSASAEAVELRFNRRLGAHDLTLIKVNEAAAFRQWVNDYFRQKGLPAKASYPAEEAVVTDYLRRGISYFVVDYVEVGREPRSVEPVLYRFRSRELYYPLKTSNTFGGEGAIELITITPTTLCRGGYFEYQEAGSKALYADTPCLNLPTEASTSALIVPEEGDLAALFAPGESFFKDGKAFIQVIRYRGAYQFDEDVFIDVSKGAPEVSGILQEDEQESVFSPGAFALRPGCTPYIDSLEQSKCKLKPDRGPCKGNFTRYYFDLQSRQCRPFSWGGCGGVVPFRTEQECRDYAAPGEQ